MCHWAIFSHCALLVYILSLYKCPWLLAILAWRLIMVIIVFMYVFTPMHTNRWGVHMHCTTLYLYRSPLQRSQSWTGSLYLGWQAILMSTLLSRWLFWQGDKNHWRLHSENSPQMKSSASLHGRNHSQKDAPTFLCCSFFASKPE